MTELKPCPVIGSLFSGYGGLDLAVEQVTGGRTVWVSDIDPGACAILAHRFPDCPNLGDVSSIDWSTVPPIDVLCGGSPCQDLSTAGRRAGMAGGTRSSLWVMMREAIAQLRPSLVVWENVRGALSATAASAMESEPGRVGDASRGPALRALGRVLGDLAELGYDAEWCGIRAADVGAAHGRWRVFLTAHPEGERQAWCRGSRDGRPGPADRDRRPVTLNGNGFGTPLGVAVRMLPTPTSTDGNTAGESIDGRRERGYGPRLSDAVEASTPQQWGDYADAIARAEALYGPAPSPTEPGRNSKPRLSPRFVEWLMCLPAGWVTDVPGLTRNQQLKALGNGVCPPQAVSALEHLLADNFEKDS